ncbi:MAG: transporter substrate-binding domain-containing protein [Ruminococcaceae bacterium]|nr:transporter substrate-binding domain-containing protein [Oscillospiraceae bacterium]
MMKKIFAMLLSVLLVLSLFAGCGSSGDSDMAYIKDKGKLIVGITDYAPMDYKDENGEWTGFDAEFARLVAKELDLEVEFFLIAAWSKKVFELDSKNIDCIWNGMTIDEELLSTCSVSDPYVINAQVVVMKADAIANYPDAASLADLKFAAENGSAGQKAAESIGVKNIVAVQDQAAALMEVAAGTADACVIDITMAYAMTGEGTSYDDLGVGLTLTSEEYGIGFRKGSDVTAKVNEIMAKFMEDGTLDALAQKYNLTLAK